MASATKTAKSRIEIGKEFRRAIDGTETLDEVCAAVCGVVRMVAGRGSRVGFVSGVISSDGPQLVMRNLDLLRAYTGVIGSSVDYPVFCAANVFDEKLRGRYSGTAKPEWWTFWRKVLGSGISDFFTTPRWGLSRGGDDEHTFVKYRKVELHYLEEDPQLLDILRGTNGYSKEIARPELRREEQPVQA